MQLNGSFFSTLSLNNNGVYPAIKMELLFGFDFKINGDYSAIKLELFLHFDSQK